MSVFLGVYPSPASAQERISNGTFSNGLTGWTTSSWAGGSSFGTNANGPTSTAAASGNYAFAGGGTYNLLQQGISGVTNGGTYRLTFQVGAKSGQGSTFGVLSLFDGLAGNYNPASFDYRPSDASFGTYTVDFTARGATDLWLRNDGGGYAAYDNVSVTSIGSVQNALNYSSASGFSEITSALSGSGKVTVNSGTGGLTLTAANTYSGGTEVTGGKLFVTGSGTLGATTGSVTVDNAVLDLRNQQTRTGTMTIKNNGFILSGDGTGSLVNNGSAFEFQGGSIELPLSGTGGMIITGGGRITSSNSYTGATTISATPGWFGANTFFVDNANALGAASGDLTISGGTVGLQSNTITRSGNVRITGGTVHTGTISKSGTDYDIQGGQIEAVLAGTAGLTKSGAGNASLTASNTYSGGTTINAGTLVVSGAGGLGDAAGAVTVNTGAGLYISSGLTVNRTGNVTVNGGSLTTDNFNIGTISVSGGNFIANNAAVLALKLAGTAGLTVGGTGDTYLWANNSYTGATVINSGKLVLGGSGAISANSAVQIASGASLDLTGNFAPNSINRTFAGLTGGGVLNGNGGTVTVNKSSGSDTFGGVIQGAQGLVKSGAGTLVLSGANTHTGGTVVNGGTLVVNSAGGMGDAAGTVTVNAGATLYTGGGLTVSRTGNFTVNGGSLTTDNYNLGTISVSGGNFIANNAAVLAVKLAGTGGLTVGGSGETILWADSSYTGATVINSGQLTLGGAGAISTNSTLQIASGAVINLTGSYAANNINRTFAGLTGSGVLYGGGGTVTVNKAAGTDTFTGDIQGGQGLIKSGAGTLALGGASSYAGITTVNEGYLTIAHGSALGSTDGGTVVNSGGQLRLNATSGGITVGNEALTIRGTGIAGDTGGALRNAAGNNTFQGKITLAGDANIGAAGSTTLTLDVASGNAIEANNFNLNFVGAGSHLVNDAINLGSGGLTKTGTGTATLNGTLGAGSLNVNQGTLALGSAGRLAANAVANVTGGTLSTGGNETITRLNATGGTVNLTGDILTVTGTGANKSMVNSSTTLTGGTISVQGAIDYQATSGSTALSVASGGTLSGSGTTSGTLAVSGNLAPGNSTGIMNVGSTTFLSGGKYSWEIDNFSGTVGNSWDFLNITGNLDITAGTGSGSQFLIDVVSLLSAGDTSGLASNFTDGMNYSFAIATASGTINNYDAGKFLINTAGFQNAFTGTWGTSLGDGGKSLNITYTAATAIPEPSTGVLFLSALGILALRRRFSVN